MPRFCADWRLAATRGGGWPLASAEETSEGVTVEDVVGVVGAGLMGAGIAQVAAQAGYRVHLYDVDSASLERGVAASRLRWPSSSAKGATSEDVEVVMARITPTTVLGDLADGIDRRRGGLRAA